MRSSLRPLSLAAVLAGAALVCCYGGMILQGMIHSAAPALAPPLLAVAPLAYLLFTLRIPPREALGPRAFPTTVLVTLVAVPVFAGLAHLALTLPIVRAMSDRDPESLAAALVSLLALVASIAVVAAAAAWLRASERRGVAVLLALAAPAAVAAALALVVAGLLSPRPAPDGYASALPIVGRTSATTPATGEDVTEVGDVAVTRRCLKAPLCDVWLTRRGEAVPRGNLPDFSARDPLVLVRRDVARDLWLVDGSGGREAIFAENEPPHQAAYRGSDVERVRVRPRTLTRGLAPPRGWIVAAALGAVIAAGRLWRRRAAKKALAEVLAAEPGVLDEGGWIVLDRGGDPLRAPTGMAAGPVLVVAPGGGAAGTYRTEAARPAERVLAGTRAYLAEEARHAITTIDARALAATLITVAPLATAWIEGLR